MLITFLRHGPTDWNQQGRIQGHTDVPLSAEGFHKMQALRAPFPAPRIFSSPLRRARQTVEALGLKNPVLDTRLMEQNWGDWEGLTKAEILQHHGQEAFKHAGQAGEFRPPGGESTSDLLGRVAAFLQDVANEKEDAIAIAHLGVLRAAYTLVTRWDMATPMPSDLDVSKALILEGDTKGRFALYELNVELTRLT